MAQPSDRARIVAALLRVLHKHDRETHAHSVRVARLSLQLSDLLHTGRYERRTLHFGALLHDIGKLAIPSRLLRKQTSLTPEEYRLMQEHVESGFRILHLLEDLEQPAAIVLTSHEWFDGRGYPHGLAGDQIPLAARIVAVADAFDVITRCVRYSWHLSPEAAVAEIDRCVSTQFDPDVADALRFIVSSRALGRLPERQRQTVPVQAVMVPSRRRRR